jgi:cytochrome c biogenesis protein CcmG, thiol:disulfide interchange protein DsbE
MPVEDRDMPLSKHSEPPKPTSRVIAHFRLVLIWLVVAAGLAGVYWLMIQEQIAPNPTAHAGVGKPLPFLELQPLTGGPPAVSRTDLADHVTLMNFWGTWCPPCCNELPHMAELRQRYAGQDAFRLLAVSCPPGDQRDDVQSLREETVALLKRLNLDLPAYYDPDDATLSALRILLKFEQDRFPFPTTVLLDRKGVIRAVWEGYRPGVETEMERYIGTVLEEEQNAK